MEPKEREAAFKEYFQTLKERAAKGTHDECLPKISRIKNKTAKQEEEAAASKGFMELLRSTKEINADTTFAEAKRLLDDHSKFRRVSSYSTREALFDAYIAELKGLSAEELEEIKQEKARKEREEASLRERESRVKRDKSYMSRETDSHR